MRDQPAWNTVDTCEEELVSPTKRRRNVTGSDKRVSKNPVVVNETVEVEDGKRIVRDLQQSAIIADSLAVLSHALENVFLPSNHAACNACIDSGVIQILCLKVGYVLEIQNNSLCRREGNNVGFRNAASDDVLFIKRAVEAIHMLYHGCSVHVLQKSIHDVGDETLPLLTSVIEIHLGATLETCVPQGQREASAAAIGASTDDEGFHLETVRRCLSVILLISQLPQGCDAILAIRSHNKDTSTNTVNTIIRVVTVVTLCNCDLSRNDAHYHDLTDEILHKAIGFICNLTRYSLEQETRTRLLLQQITQEKGEFLVELLRQIHSRASYSPALRAYAKDAKTELGVFNTYTKQNHGARDANICEEAREGVDVDADDVTRVLQMLRKLSHHAKDHVGPKEEVFMKVICDDGNRSLRLMGATGLQLVMTQNGSAHTLTPPRPDLMKSIVQLSKQEPDRSVKLKLAEAATLIAAAMSPDWGDIYDENLQLLIELMYSDDMKCAEYAIHAIYQQTLSASESNNLHQIRKTRIANCPGLLDALATVSSYLRVTLSSQKYIVETLLNISDETINGEQMTRPIILEALLDLASLPSGRGWTGREEQTVDLIRSFALCTIVQLARAVPNRRRLAKQAGLMPTLIRFVTLSTARAVVSTEDSSLKSDVKDTLIKLMNAV